MSGFVYEGKDRGSILKGITVDGGVLTLQKLPPADFFRHPEKYILEFEAGSDVPTKESADLLSVFRKEMDKVVTLRIEGHETKRGKMMSDAESPDTAFVFTPELAAAIRNAVGGGFTRLEMNNSNITLKGDGIERQLIEVPMKQAERDGATDRISALDEEISRLRDSLARSVRLHGPDPDGDEGDVQDSLRQRLSDLEGERRHLDRALRLNHGAFEMVIRQDAPKAIDDAGRMRFAFADLDVPMVLKVEAKDTLSSSRGANMITPGFMAGSRILAILAPDADLNIGEAAFSQITNTATALSRIREYREGAIDLMTLRKDMARFSSEFRKTFTYTADERGAAERFIKSEMNDDLVRIGQDNLRYEETEEDRENIRLLTEEKEKLVSWDSKASRVCGYRFLADIADMNRAYETATADALHSIGDALEAGGRKAGDSFSADAVKSFNAAVNEAVRSRYVYLSGLLEKNFARRSVEAVFADHIKKALPSPDNGMDVGLFSTDGDDRFWNGSMMAELLISVRDRSADFEKIRDRFLEEHYPLPQNPTQDEKKARDDAKVLVDEQFRLMKNDMIKAKVTEDPVVTEWLNLYQVYANAGVAGRDHVFDFPPDCFSTAADAERPSSFLDIPKARMFLKAGTVPQGSSFPDRRSPVFQNSFFDPMNRLMFDSGWKERLDNMKNRSAEQRENMLIESMRLLSDGRLSADSSDMSSLIADGRTYGQIYRLNMRISSITETKKNFREQYASVVNGLKERNRRQTECRQRIIRQTDEIGDSEFRPVVGLTGSVCHGDLSMAAFGSRRVGTVEFRDAEPLRRNYQKRFEALKALTVVMKEAREKEYGELSKRLDGYDWECRRLDAIEKKYEELKREGKITKEQERYLTELPGLRNGYVMMIKDLRENIRLTSDLYDSVLKAWEAQEPELRPDNSEYEVSKMNFDGIDEIENRITSAISEYIAGDTDRVNPNHAPSLDGTLVKDETREHVSRMLGGPSAFAWDWENGKVVQLEKMAIEREEIRKESGSWLADERSGGYRGIAAGYDAEGADGTDYSTEPWTDEFRYHTAYHTARRDSFRQFIKKTDAMMPQNAKLLVRLKDLTPAEVRDMMSRNADILAGELKEIRTEISGSILSEEQNRAEISALRGGSQNGNNAARIAHLKKVNDDIARKRKELFSREKQLTALSEEINAVLEYRETPQGRFTQIEKDAEAYYDAEKFLHDNSSVESYILNYSARGQDLKRRISEYERRYGTLDERTGQYSIKQDSPIHMKGNEEKLKEYERLTHEFGEFMKKGMPTVLSDLADGGTGCTDRITVGNNMERTYGYGLDNEARMNGGLDVSEEGDIMDVTVSDILAKRLSRANRYYIRMGRTKERLAEIGTSLCQNVHYYSASQAVTIGVLLAAACGIKAISAAGRQIATHRQETLLKRQATLLWLKEEIEKNGTGKTATAFFSGGDDRMYVSIGDLSVRNSEYEKLFTGKNHLEVSRKELGEAMNDYEEFCRLLSKYGINRDAHDRRRQEKAERDSADRKKYGIDTEGISSGVVSVPRSRPTEKNEGRLRAMNDSGQTRT